MSNRLILSNFIIQNKTCCMINKKYLLVIDVQNGMFGLPLKLYKSKVKLDNIYSLIKKARSENALIVCMQHCGQKDNLFEEGS
jgi:nicotinamidase-related amidase